MASPEFVAMLPALRAEGERVPLRPDLGRCAGESIGDGLLDPLRATIAFRDDRDRCGFYIEVARDRREGDPSQGQGRPDALVLLFIDHPSRSLRLRLESN